MTLILGKDKFWLIRFCFLKKTNDTFFKKKSNTLMNSYILLFKSDLFILNRLTQEMLPKNKIMPIVIKFILL